LDKAVQTSRLPARFRFGYGLGSWGGFACVDPRKELVGAARITWNTLTVRGRYNFGHHLQQRRTRIE
jgi:hypothetical protein